jgi:glutamine amidotransferase
VVRGWPDSVADLARTLPVLDLLTLDAATDAALLWALVRHRLRAGVPLAVALAETTRDVHRAAPGSRVNLLLTDGRTAAATTLGHSLWVRSGDGAVHLASEPLDDHPGWQPVPERSVVAASPDTVDITQLETT